MKKIIFGITISLLFFANCEKNLDPEIYGTINTTVYPESESDYEIYMMEVYKTFTSKWEYFPMGDGTMYHMWFSIEESFHQLFDCPTDQMITYTAWGDRFTIPTSANFEPYLNYGEPTSPFNKVKEVTRMTMIIGDLEKADINEDKKNQFLGEAKVARGWTMFYLLHLYGTVPVILDPKLVDDTEALSDLTRPSREVFVNSIIGDLRFAADNLMQVMPNYGRFNKGLALTLLMRLYLNEKDWANARSVGTEIMAMGFSLVDDYTSLFVEATEKNTETIYAISCDASGTGRPPDANFNPFSHYVYPGNYPHDPGWGGVGDAPYMATWEFYNSFDANDTRRERLLPSFYDKDSVLWDSTKIPGAILEKYPKIGDESFAGNDIPIARYADVLLMMAEAINNIEGPTTDAIGYVNDVRERAGIGDLPAADVASKEAFNEAIFRERGWELYFEGVRKFDLERFGKWPDLVNEVAGKNASLYLLPIPRYALTLSDGKLVQNSGYPN